jgi:U3 small nucleolar RNA-associated protein 3
MAKKRKASGRAAEPQEPREEDSKMRITTFEDVADSEDEFHMNRDKVLLEEGPAAKRLRKWKEQGKFAAEFAKAI